MVNIGFGKQYLRKKECGDYVKFLCNLQPNTTGFVILTHGMTLPITGEN